MFLLRFPNFLIFSSKFPGGKEEVVVYSGLYGTCKSAIRETCLWNSVQPIDEPRCFANYEWFVNLLLICYGEACICVDNDWVTQSKGL